MIFKLLVLLCVTLQVVTAFPNTKQNERLERLRAATKAAGAESRSLANIGGHYYYFGTVIQVDIYTASLFCADFSMYLVALENPEKTKNITTYIRDVLDQANDFWWTSGVLLNDGWLWSSTGSAFPYFNWDTDEPNHEPYPSQACVWVKDELMGDYPCDFENYFICEEKKC